MNTHYQYLVLFLTSFFGGIRKKVPFTRNDPHKIIFWQKILEKFFLTLEFMLELERRIKKIQFTKNVSACKD